MDKIVKESLIDYNNMFKNIKLNDILILNQSCPSKDIDIHSSSYYNKIVKFIHIPDNANHVIAKYRNGGHTCKVKNKSINWNETLKLIPSDISYLQGITDDKNIYY